MTTHSSVENSIEESKDSFSNNPIRFQFKIVLLGDGGSGKTCLTNRYCYNLFMDTNLTIGLSFNSYSLQARENDKKFRIGLSIWDFGGQKRFKPLLPQFITGANSAFLVHDLTSFKTLVNVEKEWLPLLRNNAGDVPIVLVGTKSDLLNDQEVNNRESISSVQKKIGAVESFETSSLTGQGIEQAFKRIVLEILSRPPYDKRNIELL